MPLVHATTERVPLSTPGEWIDLKTRLSKGDTTRIEAAAFKLQMARGSLAGGDVDVDLTLDYEAMTFIGLEVGITAWSFEEPVTPQNIRALAPEDYEIITERANELWQPRGEEETRNLSVLPVPPSRARAASRRS